MPELFLERTFNFMHMSVTSHILSISPWKCQLRFFYPIPKFTNQARLGQIMFKPIKYLMTTRSGDLCGASMLAWLKPLVWFWELKSSHLSYFVNDVNYVYYLYCHGQGNWLVCSIILVGLFSYWVTLLHCWMWEQTAIASLRYF